MAESLPPFPIVDTHAHLFDTDLFYYPWLDSMGPLKRPHLMDDYSRAIGSIAIEKIVFVEVAAEEGSGLHEAAWVARLAQGQPRLAGIVAAAPLELGKAVRPHLDQLVQHHLLRGVRRIAAPPFQSDPDFCLRPSFIEGVRLLADYGLTFELGVQRQDLGKAFGLVRKCPEVRFVLNHMANPAISEGIINPWASDIRALAEMENVYCKISGQIPNAGPGWTPRRLAPYIEVALEAFGSHRTMFGSDWPLTNLNGGDFVSWVKALWQIVADRPETDVRNLFRDTAIGFYNL